MSIPSKISINRQGQSLGPYTEDEAREHIASGNLVSSDLAWHEGMTNWQSLGSIPEFTACYSQSAATAQPITPVQTGLQFPLPGTQPTSTALEANQLRKPKRKGFLISFFLLIIIVLWIVAWRYFPELSPWKTLLGSILVTWVLTSVIINAIESFAKGRSGRGGGSSGNDCSSSSSCSSCGGGD